MDHSIQRLLNDKLYDRRKQGALELEKVVRDSAFRGDHEVIQKVVDQLCHDYAYAVHQPHARNGGLIGLAAASIALGSEGVAPYLKEIVPPVLACFSDQDARVRYYACESMYNIAKVAKGEILLFFNEIFDALSKLASDSEPSVKNGAELLDRLVKDIVSESAAHHVSVLQLSEKQSTDPDTLGDDLPTAFSLPKFIPLLKERIHVLSAFTRTFLVSWLTLLDTIPDLELVSYLPEFIAGLIKFLGDSNRDVNVATQGLLDRFLAEIKRIARLKKGLAESRKGQGSDNRRSVISDNTSLATDPTIAIDAESSDNVIDDSEAEFAVEDEEGMNTDGDWIPGQDVQIDYPKLLDILVGFVDTSYDEEMQLTALRWIDSFFEISPEDILPFVPRLLDQILPAVSSSSAAVKDIALRANTSLLDYIFSLTLSEETPEDHRQMMAHKLPKERASTPTSRPDLSGTDSRKASPRNSIMSAMPSPPPDLDYGSIVTSLTLQFLSEHESTRTAALSWLIMLHRKAPKKVAAFNDGIFPALLKTLSDTSETVVTKDLQLLSQISRNSEDTYFKSFMVNLLQLFSTDRTLLEVRGNLIIRQLCLNLSPERIYRTLADCLEKEDDMEFASIMVQNLNNNLITAPELSELRKRLRNLDSREGQTFFVALFRSWCHNAVSTFSLCLLAQAYEQAYNLLQVFAELEMTINMLIQIDKLVQLLESPVFTYLRLQLLEPERYPYLYKCLYGVLMLLPQSSAFAALKNRLNSVSNIGLLHTAPRLSSSSATSSTSVNTPYDRTSTRLNRREDSASSTSMSIRWVDLLEKFKSVQEKTRASQRNQQQRHFDGSAGPGESPSSLAFNGSMGLGMGMGMGMGMGGSLGAALSGADNIRNRDKTLPDTPRSAFGGIGGGRASPAAGDGAGSGPGSAGKGGILTPQRQKSGLPNLGRLRIGGRSNKR